jgi:hypothetical protein
MLRVYSSDWDSGMGKVRTVARVLPPAPGPDTTDEGNGHGWQGLPSRQELETPRCFPAKPRRGSPLPDLATSAWPGMWSDPARQGFARKQRGD